VIAAALLLPILAMPDQVEVGPFVITSHDYREESFPYPRNRKFSVLQWKSPSGPTVYSLNDDGEYVTVSFEVLGKGGKCLSNNDPVRLTVRPSVRFNIECELLDAVRAKRLAAEIRAARPYFAAAYANFYQATLRQHGPSLQRCRETGLGNHGPICVAYWDEGRSVTDQKNKRTN
jgi:hypothetical protein